MWSGPPAGDGRRGADRETASRASMPTTRAAADGRSSTVRDRLWLAAEETRSAHRRRRAPAAATDRPARRHARPTSASTMVVTIPRPVYLQCGVLDPEGPSRTFKGRRLRWCSGADVAASPPPLAGVIDDLDDWDAVSCSSVEADLLRRWSRARSSVHRRRGPCHFAGVRRGINYAVQDAVATANLLGPVLRATPFSTVRPSTPRPGARSGAGAARPRRCKRLQAAAHRAIGSGRDAVHDPPNRFEATVREPCSARCDQADATPVSSATGLRPSASATQALEPPPRP